MENNHSIAGYEDYYRQDEIDPENIKNKIQIWAVTGIMDGGTIILYCRHENKLFQIKSKQFTIEENHPLSEFLSLNEAPIRIHSEKEKVILKLIQESVNAADPFWFIPKWIKFWFWSKRKKAYWVHIFKRELLIFVKTKKYLQLTESRSADHDNDCRRPWMK